MYKTTSLLNYITLFVNRILYYTQCKDLVQMCHCTIKLSQERCPSSLIGRDNLTTHLMVVMGCQLLTSPEKIKLRDPTV